MRFLLAFLLIGCGLAFVEPSPSVEFVTHTSGTTCTFRLNWKAAVTQPDKYRVYRNTGAGLVLYDSVDGGTTQYTDTQADGGYAYEIRARYGSLERTGGASGTAPACIFRIDSIIIGEMYTGSVIPAFSGCVGWGCGALDRARDSVRAGVWSLKVWRINSLAATGNGTLKAALDSAELYPSAYNVVVWDTGGTHAVATLTSIDLRNTYVAGQTARGGGAQWQDVLDIDNGTANSVFRYFTLRKVGNSCVFLSGSDTVVVDHLSGSHCALTSGHNIFTYQGDSISPPATPEITRAISANYNLGCWPDDTHATTALVGGQPGPEPPIALITLWREYYCGPGRRLPWLGGDTVTAVGVIAYNWWQSDPIALSDQVIADIIDSYAKNGPANGSEQFVVALREVLDEISNGDQFATRSFHVTSLRANRNSFTAQNQEATIFGSQRVVDCTSASSPPEEWCAATGDTIPRSFSGTKQSITIRTDTLPTAFFASANVPFVGIADVVLDSILDLVGNSRGVTCGGLWATTIDGVKRRSVFDSTRVAEFSAATGLSAPPDVDTLTAPTIAAGGTRCADTDGNNLPDAYESNWNQTPGGLSASGTCDHNGYLHIECWANGLFSERFTIYARRAALPTDSVTVEFDGVRKEVLIGPPEGAFVWVPSGLQEQWTIGPNIVIKRWRSGVLRSTSTCTLTGTRVVC